MNPLRSMTGFATAQTTFRESDLVCEIRSLNSRYLEINVKLPRLLADLEQSIKEKIRQKIERGKIFYTLSFTTPTAELQNFRIDPVTVQTYKNLLEQIREAAGLDSPVQLDHLLFFKDIITYEEDKSVDEELVNTIYQLTDQTLELLNEMRAQEGSNLLKDLEERLGRIEQLTEEVARMGKDNPRQEFERLYQRLLSLLEEEKIDRSRLEQELAIISDRVDITEETVRMSSHLQLFRKSLQAGSPIGKKLNFLLQEMHREANTMANKTTMVEISHRVVIIKEEIEKMREQIQNIE